MPWEKKEQERQKTQMDKKWIVSFFLKGELVQKNFFQGFDGVLLITSVFDAIVKIFNPKPRTHYFARRDQKIEKKKPKEFFFLGQIGFSV